MLKKTPLKRKALVAKKCVLRKIGVRGKKIRKVSVERTNKMFKLFLKIWDERPHVSEVSGEHIYGEPLSIYFHHILPKSKWPELALCEDNIIILTFAEHQRVENNPTYFAKINEIEKKLKDKYGNNKS